MTLQELDRYRPIPYGGVNLLAIVLLPVFFYGLTRWILGIQTGVETPQLIVAIFPLLTAVLSFVAGVAIHMKVDAEVSPIQWLKRYWECNVVGYSVLVHRCQGGRLDLRLGYRHTDDVCRMYGLGQCPACQSCLYLVLRLGGWRSKWGIIAEAGLTHPLISAH